MSDAWMRKLFFIAVFCQVGLGQAVYSGSGFDSGAGIYGVWGNCAATNYCAYAGVDVIPWGTVPNFGGTVNNNSEQYDTSFLGHTQRDGTVFNNSALLSPITRVTDTLSTGGGSSAVNSYTAGLGGAGMSPGLSNADTTLISLTQANGGAHYIARFNPKGANKGLPCSNALAGCTTWFSNTGTAYPPAGSPIIWLTAAQDANGSCSSNCAITGFATPQFDHNNRNLEYSFGVGITGITPYYIAQDTGEYWAGTPVADFKYGMPAFQASAWQTSTNYSYGQYVIHALTGAEMATGGTWATGSVYAVGDIVTGAGNTCMYKVTVASGTATSGSAPPFRTSDCKLDTLTDGAGNKWQGTNSTAQFVYQETNPACTVSSPCRSTSSAFQWIATPAALATDGAMSLNSQVLTSASNPFLATQVGQTISVSGCGNSGGTTPLLTTIASFQNTGQVTLAVVCNKTGGMTSASIALTGHPDMLSRVSGLDANGLVWTSIEPAFVPTSGNTWSEKGDISIDTLNTIVVPGAPGGGSYAGASKFGAAFSMNTYGMQKSSPAGGLSFATWNGGQGSGTDVMAYDSVTNVYHHVDTVTGIWIDYTCSGGTGPICAGGSWLSSTIGAFKAITDPFGTGQPCPMSVHGLNLSKNGHYGNIASGGYQYDGPCSGAGLNNTRMWEIAAPFDPYASLQSPFHGQNHYAIGTDKLFAWSASGWPSTAGVYVGVYANNNFAGNGGGNPVVGAGAPPPFSVYLPAFASQGSSQAYPYPGCYVTSGGTIKSPDCDLSEALDSHLSAAADPGTDTWPVCGTTYNLATLNPVPFTAWQNMETCYQTSPLYPAGYVPNSGWAGSPPGNGSPLCTPGVNCSQTYGNAWQFTHTFATGTSATFSTQFQISQYSTDGNWMFWSSDWNCQLGSNLPGNAAPAVWNSGTYYQQLMMAAVPASPNSLCGLPWAANSAYVAGNLINPIEGTGGKGAVDDVYQAITSGTSGPPSNLVGKQPKCGSASCWTQTNPPTVAPATVTGASEAGTTGTVTVSGAGLTLTNGVLVTLAGFSPSGWNGTFAFSGTSGTGLTSFTLAGMPSGLGTVTAMGTAAAQGDTVCDSTSGAGDFLNPALPYSSSCAVGVVWQDLGPQTQRGDVFAVNLGNQ